MLSEAVTEKHKEEIQMEKYFEIHVQGHLNPDWAHWLEDLEMEWLDNGEMILAGTLVDQAALIGILNKLNGLNLTILSVNETR
jgi:hypothetical protein